METKRLIIGNNNDMHNKAVVEEAAALLSAGEIVAFPTETVYGLGADATNEKAVAKIFAAKGRPQDNPLIAHVATVEQLRGLVDNLPQYVEDLIKAYSPGPLTYILPTNGTCATNVTAGLSTIGVRIPDHPVALAILKACNLPIAAPSANVSGKPSPTAANHVFEDLQGKIAGLVDGGITGVGLESTVISCRADDVVILRPGGITREQIEKIVPVADIVKEDNAKPASPGMKYKHYSPEVPLWLVKGNAAAVQKVVDNEQRKGKKVAVLASRKIYEQVQADQRINLGDTLPEVANRLYDALRTFKKGEIDLILTEVFPESGIGEAIMNRLRKAMTKYIEE